MECNATNIDLFNLILVDFVLLLKFSLLKIHFANYINKIVKKNFKVNLIGTLKMSCSLDLWDLKGLFKMLIIPLRLFLAKRFDWTMYFPTVLCITLGVYGQSLSGSCHCFKRTLYLETSGHLIAFGIYIVNVKPGRIPCEMSWYVKRVQRERNRTIFPWTKCLSMMIFSLDDQKVKTNFSQTRKWRDSILKIRSGECQWWCVCVCVCVMMMMCIWASERVNLKVNYLRYETQWLWFGSVRLNVTAIGLFIPLWWKKPI